MKKFELLAASALAMFSATSALAQTTPSTPAPAPQAEANTDGDDIVVTATKREQTLLDTPVAVSVTSAATIEQAQIRDLKDLQSVVPSLRVNQLQSSANTNFIIRGFGNGANNAGIEPSVGVFIDGVYRSRSAAQISDLPNLKRIEVLRGPQSTLFGKNASAGIISIVTAEPAFKFGGTAEATYGNYNAVVLKGAVTGPISDTLAFSIGGNYNRRDGYAYDVQQKTNVNDRNRWGIRGQLLFQPNADFKIRVIGDYDRIDENCCVAGNLINGPTGAIVNALAGGTGIDAQNVFSYRVYNNFLSSNKIDNYGGSIQADYNFGKFGLTSITAYREVKSATNQDSDFTGADLIGRNSANVGIDTFTQELRLATDFEGPLNFLLGGFYFNEKINQRNQITFGSQFRPYGNALIQGATGGALNVATLESTFGALEGNPAKYTGTFFRTGDGLNESYALKDESFSIFGTADFKPVDRLTLTAGFNYTDDRKRFSTNVVSSDVFSSINFDAPQYAPFRNQLLYQGGLAQLIGTQLGLGRSATAAEIGAFAGANPAAFSAINAGALANANANQNNPAANPLAGLRPLQFLPPFQNVPNAVEPGKTSDGNFSYTLRAAYKLDNHLNAYVTYATGFKASSVNLSRDSRPTAADLIALRTAGLAVVNLGSGSRFAGPEKSRVIEGGIKGQYRSFAFNLAVFQQQITGFQSNVFTGTGFSLLNAPKQSTFGIEFDGSVTPFKALTLNGAVTYLDPKYDSFPNGGAIVAGTYTVGPVNLSGTRPAGIPEFAASVGATYTQQLSHGMKLLLRGDFDYQTPVQIAEGVLKIEREVKELNLAATLQFENGLEVSAWGRNVTNNQYITTIFSSVAQSGSVSGYPNQPVTYGGTIRFKF
ncbi:MAG: TonB-dependent receptor [Sphingomonas sp.]|jgi:outer membrane receptor protein involved in Fe transport|uniref:TonB-dependent receptor n=1 Tax=Sphingomonas sp. TaxID=28214 RepID=UPI0035662651